LTEQQLLDELRRVPEIRLPELDDLRNQEIEYAKARGAGSGRLRLRDRSRELRIAESCGLLLQEGSAAGLPIRTTGCVLNIRAAETLGRGAVDLRWPTKLAATSGQATFMTAALRRDADGEVSILDKQSGKTVTTFAGLPRSSLRSANDLRNLFEVTWPNEKVPSTFDVVPVLAQVLQVEGPEYRRLLVEELARIPGRKAGAALARRALYDPSPEIRQAAIASLKDRPSPEFQDIVLDGLRYPWAPVADHAADILIATHDVQAVPRLVEMQHLPDPAAPYLNEKKQQVEIRELVGINHMRSCCLCHAPSYSSSDWVPGRVMVPGVEIPAEYYGSSTGAFVRADITYLRQDFSTMERVDNAKPWPELQRFDYLVRTRVATPEEFTALQAQPADADYPQRRATLRALKRLSGRGSSSSAQSER
jgi:hypothetical protein